MMANIGLPGLLFVILLGVLWTVPFWKILPRYGINKYVSLICLIPWLGSIASLVLLWIIAFTKAETK